MRSLAGFLEASAPGVVLDVDLLAPDVLLDRLGVLDHILAHADLFLDHRALAHDDLFLGHRHDDLVLTDLGLGGLAIHGHALHADLLVAGGNLYLLAVGPHALTNLELTGLALAGACGELFFGPLHPELVLVFEVVSAALVYTLIIGGVLAELTSLGIAHRDTRAGRFTVVIAVGATTVGSVSVLQAVVGVDFVLELRRYLLVVVEGGPVLDRILLRRDLDDLPLVVDPSHLERDQSRAGPEEAHLDADVLGGIVLVEEQVVYLADLLVVLVVDRVSCILILYCREPVAALFHVFSFRREINYATVLSSFC